MTAVAKDLLGLALPRAGLPLPANVTGLLLLAATPFAGVVTFGPTLRHEWLGSAAGRVGHQRPHVRRGRSDSDAVADPLDGHLRPAMASVWPHVMLPAEAASAVCA